MTRVIQHADIDSFIAAAGDFLARHEAEHNLLLGISAAIKTYPERYPDAYMATAEDQGQVVAAALMTPPRNVVLSLSDVSGAAELFADDLRASGRAAPAVSGSPSDAEAFARRWQTLTGQPYEVAARLRIYRLDKVKPVTGVGGTLRPASRADKDLLIEWTRGFNHDAMGHAPPPMPAEELVERFLTSKISGLMLWEDGQPVSMAAFQGPTPNGIRVGLVYTPPDQRNKGYASACVAALSQKLLDEGRQFCFLFTDLANPTSNHIYQEIGYQPVSDVNELKLTL